MSRRARPWLPAFAIPLDSTFPTPPSGGHAMPRPNRRDFLRTSLAVGSALALPAYSTFAASANDAINLGFISCGGRGGEQMRAFSKLEGVRFAGLCDPDRERLESAKQRFPEAKGWADLRALLDDDGIDGCVPPAILHAGRLWAMQAGKDVYVEKPLSHSQWEGRQTVAAAKKYGKICQVGTQQRSDPMQAEIKQFLHEEKALGEIKMARVNRYGVRAPIGKRSTPLPVPEGLDYDLWLGPAQEKPIYRDKLQYDWHWDWNTGSGEMGNWGVHVLDDLRNNVFLDKVALPKRVLGGGGRVVWDDAGETPNVHFAWFDTGSIPVVIGLTNLPAGPDSKKSPERPGPASGYMAWCEGGRFEGQRGKAAAFDNEGKLIKEFKGNSGGDGHQRNFLDAVRSRDASLFRSGVQVGHDSTGWCNVANIAFRAGGPYRAADARQATAGADIWEALLESMGQLLGAYGLKLESDAIRLSPMLELDPQAEKFVGDHAELANGLLKREYRQPYVVPQIEA